jgi:membrane protein DedA with SNARE-associated domain
MIHKSIPFEMMVSLVSTYGYFAIFLAMVAEGPVVTTAAAFAAGTGIFNIYVILLLSILGDVTADILFFAIGYWSRITLIEKYGRYIGLTEARIGKVQKLIRLHPWRTLLAIKLTPGVPPPGLVAVGISKMKPKKYAMVTSLITIPKCILFVALGYYSGRVHNIATKYFHVGLYAIPIALAIIFLISYLYEKGSSILGQKIEKI